MWIEDILDPAYRKLQKLKELVREENASSKISAGIDEVIDLLEVRMTAACIDLFGLWHCAGIWAQNGGGVNENIDDTVLSKVFLFYAFFGQESE